MEKSVTGNNTKKGMSKTGKIQLAVALFFVVVLVVGVAIIMQPSQKQKDLAQAQKDLDQVQKQLDNGSITPDQAEQRIAEINHRVDQIAAGN